MILIIFLKWRNKMFLMNLMRWSLMKYLILLRSNVSFDLSRRGNLFIVVPSVDPRLGFLLCLLISIAFKEIWSHLETAIKFILLSNVSRNDRIFIMTTFEFITQTFFYRKFLWILLENKANSSRFLSRKREVGHYGISSPAKKSNQRQISTFQPFIKNKLKFDFFRFPPNVNANANARRVSKRSGLENIKLFLLEIWELRRFPIDLMMT